MGVPEPVMALDEFGAEVQAIDFGYVRSPDQDRTTPAQHPIVVIGAGPVGLSLAIDLAQRGQRVVVLDNDHKLSIGSRAICFSKRSLEIFDRLGCGEAMAATMARVPAPAAILIGPDQPWMTTEQFFEAVRSNLEQKMANWA